MYRRFVRNNTVMEKLYTKEGEGKSTLSPKVHHIICEAGVKVNQEISSESYIDEDGFLSWQKIQLILPVYKDDNYEYFVQSTTSLASVFKESESYLGCLAIEEFWQHFKNWFEWTTLPKTLERCFKILQEGANTGSVHALLLMLPILERSLGDVFLLKGRQCPSMIKDLLVTKELKDIFGDTVIQLLRVVLGPPISLNLRNVIWHGFPEPGAIHTRYGFFMLHVIMSLGKILHDRNIQSATIKHRPLVSFPQIEKVDIFPEMDTQVCGKLVALAAESAFVMPQMIPFWELAIQQYQQSRYVDCIVLLLPQLEQALRRVFVIVNNCPERILTAENTVLFTTFDEILASKLEDGTENKLRYQVGDSFVTMLLDMLMYPEGPRLRDRFSHGETSFEIEHSKNDESSSSLLKRVADHIICVCASFCMMYLRNESNLYQNEWLKTLYRKASNYKSVFHPISLYRSQLLSLFENMSSWSKIPRPNRDDLDTTVQWDKYLSDTTEYECSDVYKAGLSWMDSCDGLIPEELLRLLRPFHSVEDVAEEICDVEVSTLYRKDAQLCSSDIKTDFQVKRDASATCYFNEDEIIGLLRRITVECTNISTQICNSAEERFVQFQAKKLRSRQRETYRRMLDIVPYISCGLRLVVFILIAHLYLVDSETGGLNSLTGKKIKFLKFVLQYCENLLTYTSPGKNRWEEAEKYTSELINRTLEI